MSACFPIEWHHFVIASIGASAGLTGLLFVESSISLTMFSKGAAGGGARQPAFSLEAGRSPFRTVAWSASGLRPPTDGSKAPRQGRLRRDFGPVAAASMGETGAVVVPVATRLVDDPLEGGRPVWEAGQVPEDWRPSW